MNSVTNVVTTFPMCFKCVYCLDQFIAGLHESRDPENTEAISSSVVQEVDDVLKTFDFLFGSTLDGAIALVDGDLTRKITRLTSTATGQTMYLVKGLSPDTRSGISTGSNSRNNAGYFCVVPESSGLDVTGGYGDSSLYYCSCRSFFERNRVASSGPVLCKHILAIKLSAILKIEYRILAVKSDKEYSEIMLQHVGLL
jgi:hypothetical protein